MSSVGSEARYCVPRVNLVRSLAGSPSGSCGPGSVKVDVLAKRGFMSWIDLPS